MAERSLLNVAIVPLDASAEQRVLDVHGYQRAMGMPKRPIIRKEWEE